MAPILYAGPSQINLVTPSALAGKASTHVCVIVGNVSTNCMDVPVQFASPSVFIPNAGFSGKAGDTITLFLTGVGTMTPSPPDGAVLSAPLPTPDLRIQVEVYYSGFTFLYSCSADAFAKIQYAGPAPLEVEGLTQINFVLPGFPSANSPTGPPCFPSGPPTAQVQVTAPDGRTTVSSFAIPINN